MSRKLISVVAVLASLSLSTAGSATDPPARPTSGGAVGPLPGPLLMGKEA
jgi:hypothetical protein